MGTRVGWKNCFNARTFGKETQLYYNSVQLTVPKFEGLLDLVKQLIKKLYTFDGTQFLAELTLRCIARGDSLKSLQ